MKNYILLLSLVLLPISPVLKAGEPLEINTQSMFMEGKKALKERRLPEAIRYFEAILAEKPNLNRVRFNLAAAYFLAGNVEASRREYQIVYENIESPRVRERIEQKFALLDKMEKNIAARQPPASIPGQSQPSRQVVATKPPKKNFPDVEISTGFIYDDNVNVGPESDTVFIFDLPFALNEDATPQDDWGYQLRSRVSHTHNLNEKWSLWSGLHYSRVDYFTEDDYDYDSLNLSIAPTLRGKDWQLAFQTGYNATWLDDDLYTQSFSLSPQFTKRLDKNLISTTTAYAALLYNDAISDRDGEYYSLDHSFRWIFENGKYFIQPRAYYGYQNAQVDFLSSHQAGVGVGVFASLPGDFSLYIEPSYRFLKYEGDEPLFGKTREDNQFVLNINVGRDLGFWDLQGAVGYTFTKNSSSIDLYDYERNQFTFLIRKEF